MTKILSGKKLIKGGRIMAFTKYNNPNRKNKPKRKSPYSQQYINERKDEMYKILATCETEQQKDMVVKAFNISIYG